METSKRFALYRLYLCILFITSMYPWFTWNINSAYISLVGLFLCFLLFFKKGIVLFDKKKGIVAICFLILYLWMSKYSNFYGFAENIINWFIVVSLIGLREDYKITIITFTTKWFSILLGISLFFYFIHLLGVPLYSDPIRKGTYIHTFTNYYFFIITDGMIRFQSIFLEPGHLSMGLAPLLYLNNYNYKNKYVIIMLIAQLFTFSLAGYLVLFSGYIITIVLSNKQRKVSQIIVPIFIFYLFITLIALTFKQNLFNDLIMSRLEWNGTTIEGDDRSSQYLNFFYKKVMNSSDKWVGSEWQGKYSEKGVSGYKLYAVSFGIIGVFLVVFTYLITKLYLTHKNKLEWGFFIIVLMLLYQNSYPTWWCLIILIICGSAYLNRTESASTCI